MILVRGFGYKPVVWDISQSVVVSVRILGYQNFFIYHRTYSAVHIIFHTSQH